MGAFSRDELKSFIVGYTPDDEALIRFDWNGAHGDGLRDSNYEFRKEVLTEALAYLGGVPIELVRDLYRAETEFSKEAWCVDMRVSQLAKHLLYEGGDHFVADYLEGKYQSFDSSRAAAAFRVDREMAEHLLSVAQERLRSESSGTRRLLWQAGVETFQRWVDVLEK